MSNPQQDHFGPPVGGRTALHARLRWATHEQLWRFTNGGTITGETPAAYAEMVELMQGASPEPETQIVDTYTTTED